MKGWTYEYVTKYQKKVREGKAKPRGCDVVVDLPKPKSKESYNKRVVKVYFEEQGLPTPVFEYRFHDKRKWRIDVAWPDHRLGLEVQGGIFVQGRHSRGASLLKEWEKLNTGSAMGWRWFFCQPKDVCTQEVVNYIKEAIDESDT